ncbi:dermonecrotic toxin domain-containing protein [Pseudomonas akapageensis]|uniref:dermonecrotic toxin domain-containing protein n=1 Tax=Pseudomonas akapageensis TaxID=2609961 RepID=UPI00140E3869|nr:DUF6543 domain-containing protein [Pseudomonas akapageensis]
MHTSISPFGQLALGASLRGKLSEQFAEHPTLLSVAQWMIVDQWQARRIADHLDPVALTLMRRLPSGQGYGLSALELVLVERYCQGSTINLTPGQDFLTLEPGAEHPRAEAVDLHALERLLNECGPFLIDEYKQQLTRFWIAEPRQDESRWQWLAGHLRSQLHSAVELEREADLLDTREAATAKLVALHPDWTDRTQGNLAETQVFLLNLDVLVDQQLDPELASALVIERHLPEPQRDVRLVFTLAGGVCRIDSRLALAQVLSQNWSLGESGPVFALNLYQPSGSVFEAQARLVLAQQLRLIDVVAATAVSANAPIYLIAAIDEATSMFNIFSVAERQKLIDLHAVLPRWLRDASAADSWAYADGLLNLAIAKSQDNGASFLDGILPILDHASQKLQAAMLADHPQWQPFDVAEIRIVNHKVTSAAVATGGTFVPQGEIEDVVFTLPQLALENLTALHAGSVTLSRISGQSLPDWLTFDYVKSLITRLDIGQTYPDMLSQLLLEDPEQSKAREALFVRQLRLQLPLLAQEQRLQDLAGFTDAGVGLVAAALREPGQRQVNGHVVVFRPLAFIRKPGAPADVALNAFLIEPQDTTTGPCMLYRPLHRQSLLEFTSRQALFEEISEAGELQTDVLGRLDEQVRAVYDRGGFLQPHIVRFGLGLDFSPIEIPAPVRLGDTIVPGDPAHAIYRASARELIERARAQSVSNSESRWIGYTELGWLMLNCWLPLFNGVVATAGWMLQIFEALQSELKQGQGEQRDSVSDLLGIIFNLVLIIFVSTAKASKLQVKPLPARPHPESESARVTTQVLDKPTTSPIGQALDALDFAWANPLQRLTPAQRSLLARYKVEKAVATLGQPVPHGQWQGLYLHEQQWWAVVDDAVYRVLLNEDQARILDIDRPQEPGPWIVRGASGSWQLDLTLKLRGGMPLQRRIQALRDANRERIEALETALADYAPERNRLGEKLLRDLLQLSEKIDRVTLEELQACANELRTHYTGLTQAQEQYRALNQLKAQTSYRKFHVQYLEERASTQCQLIKVMRFEYLDHKKRMLAISAPEGVSRLRQLVNAPDSVEYRQLRAAIEQGIKPVEEMIAVYESILALKQELQSSPLGVTYLASIETDLHDEPSLKSWQAIQIHQLGALLVDYVEDRGAVLVRGIVEPSALGLHMQAELDGEAVFSDQERVEILDSCVSKYAATQETLENYKSQVKGREGARLLERFREVVTTVHDTAQAELADLLRALPQQAPEPAPSVSRAQRVIKTRNRGVVLGRTRQRTAGTAQDAVVVIDPIDGTELASFEKKPDEQIWDQVQGPSGARTATSGASLATLLSRAAPLLSEADRQVERAQRQARTANIPIEMEEILARQAEPLDDLVQQIEQTLTLTNDTDRALGQGDAALQAKALSDKADLMRSEGRRLRIEIIKARPPTASRVAYLKQQGEAQIARVGERKATARRKGRPQDYLQEYVIQDKSGNPLWYAHFHYASLDAPASQFTAAHLKTVEQRFDGGQTTPLRDNRSVIQVYRSQIDKGLAQELFF